MQTNKKFEVIFSKKKYSKAEFETFILIAYQFQIKER